MSAQRMVMMALLLASTAVAPVAFAKGKGEYHGNGHGKGERQAHGLDCPPGLAKKNNGCMPPGLAKKRHSHDTEHYQRVGDYVLIPREDWARYGLYDPRDGSGYAIRDNEILRVALDTMRVIEAVQTLADVLN
ncbi:MAG: hypothetical protein ACRCSU_16320 [Paracoccaceae bacterium]